MTRERPFRALVVDDSNDERALLSRALQREEFLCDTATDGIMAENMLRAKEYDVVISDLRMPRKHGHQLIVEILARPNPPMVIAMTGLAEPKLVVDLLERGVAEVVQKPLSYPILAAKIRAMLRKRGEPQERSRPPGPSAPDMSSVADTIQFTTEQLRSQLAMVTDTFQATINQLEAQKQQLEAGFLDSLRVLSNLISQTGDRQQSHVGRVERLAEEIGTALFLGADPMRNLKFAALLHDIGQFGMPDHLRGKSPYQLGPEDLKILQNYPVIGAALLSEVRGAEHVAEIIEQHCENFDGSGFPKGLRGNGISLESRILRVADGCDLFRMHCEGTNVVEQVHEHLVSERGRAYDPEIANIASGCLGNVFEPPDPAMTQKCRVKRLTPGMVLAENLYDEQGHFLARHGARITEQMIQRLKHLLAGEVAVYKNR